MTSESANLSNTLTKLAKVLDSRKEQLGINPKIAKELATIARTIAAELSK
jgi:hypothetical protein